MCCLMQRSQIPRVYSVTTNRGGSGVQEGGDICVPITDSCWYMAGTNIILESNFFQLKKLRCLKRSDCLWKSFKFKSKQIWIKIQLCWSLGKNSDGSSQITYIPETHCYLFYRIVIRINLNKMTYKIFLYRRTVVLICTTLKWHW